MLTEADSKTPVEISEQNERTRTTTKITRKRYASMDKDQQANKRQRLHSSHSIRKKSRMPKLPRPKQPVTFTLPQSLTSDQSSSNLSSSASKVKSLQSRGSTPMSSTPGRETESGLTRLKSTNIILVAIHRRNRNQHRNQPFYGHLSVLRRSVKKLITLYEKEAELNHSSSTPASSKVHQVPTAADFRQRFEQQSHFRSQRDMLEEHMREIMVPAAYIGFSNVVADSQFANLGLVLIGLLTDVVGIVGRMKRIDDKPKPAVEWNQSEEAGSLAAGGRLVGLSTLMTGPDHGSVVERIYDSDGAAEITEKSKTAAKAQTKGVGNGDFDMGEVVAREEIDETSKTTPASVGYRNPAETSGTDLGNPACSGNIDSLHKSSPAKSPSPSQDLPDCTTDEKSQPDEGRLTNRGITDQRGTKSQDNTVNQTANPNSLSPYPQNLEPTTITSLLSQSPPPPPPLLPSPPSKSTISTSNDRLHDSSLPAPSHPHQDSKSSMPRSSLKQAKKPREKKIPQTDLYRENRAGENKSRDKAEEKRAKSKKTKKTNAIDDLFSGFG